MNLSGLISRIQRQSNNLSGVPVRLTSSSSLAAAQVEPPYAELARAGRRMHGGLQTLAGGLAPVQAIPTNAPAIALYNSDSGGSGLSLILDWLNVFLASGTAAAGLSVFATVAKPSSAAPSANVANYNTGSLSSAGRVSRAFWATGVTLSGTPIWSALSSTLQAAGANAGQGDNPLDLGGRLIVPPGFALGLSVLSGAGTTPLYGFSAQWSELEIDVE